MSVSKIVSKHTPLFHLGFFAKDAKVFAQAHHDLYGSGPFIVLENTDTTHTFRGKETTTNITVVTGWWKDVGIEIIQQNSDNVSYLNEDNHPYGFHHICFGVSDVKGAIEEFEAAGDTVQFYTFDRPDFPVCYIDARGSSGYYIELNPQMDPLSQAVKAMAADWDGETNLFRSIADLRR
jgi:ABC-type transport system substrate-binding protein